MPPVRWIKASTLRPLLDVAIMTLRNWHYEGFLEGHYIAHQLHFRADTVDTFLAARPRNFAIAPTFDDLVNRRLVLLGMNKALACSGLKNREELRRLRVNNLLPGIQLGTSWRYSQTGLKAIKQAALNEELFTRQRACHILGLTSRALHRLISEGRLEKIPSSLKLDEHFISRTSVVKLLGELLPAWIDPYDWIDDRLHDTRPLVHVPDALAHLGINRNELEPLLDTQRLHYIRTPGGQYIQIAPESIDAYLEDCTPLTSVEIGKLFGVGDTTARKWVRTGSLTCPTAAHNHRAQPGILWPACIVAVLRECLSPGTKPIEWYRKRRHYGGMLIPDTTAADMLGVSVTTLREYARTGRVRGILTPTGTWRFTAHQLSRAKQRLKG